jgi:hypothetical protein
MLTVNGELRIHLARPLAEAVQHDQLVRQYYGRRPCARRYSFLRALRYLRRSTSIGTAGKSSLPES